MGFSWSLGVLLVLGLGLGTHGLALPRRYGGLHAPNVRGHRHDGGNVKAHATPRPQHHEEEEEEEEWSLTGIEKDPIIDLVMEVSGGSPVIRREDASLGPGLNNKHIRYETESGVSYLAKVSTKEESLAMHEAEYHGLEALYAHALERDGSAAGREGKGTGFRVPKPLGHGAMNLRGSFLLLEAIDMLPFAQMIPSVAANLGRSIAEMHRDTAASDTTTGQQQRCGFGFPRPTYLGTSVQNNTWHDNAADFFVQQRLRPQLERAIEAYGTSWGTNNRDSMDLTRFADAVLECAGRTLFWTRNEAPSLLHGDLWVGNTGADRERRRPVVFDPAPWYGPPEFDLALATVLGGFQ